jgi:ABC-type transporter Mla subunit MlaD
MDFLNRAIEQAKQLQQIAAEALAKGQEQAKPLVGDAVAKAQELQRTIVEQAPHATAAAQEQLNAAMAHAGEFIAAGKTVLEQGTAQAQPHLQNLADQAKKVADSAVSAVQNAVQKPPPPSTPDA